MQKLLTCLTLVVVTASLSLHAAEQGSNTKATAKTKSSCTASTTACSSTMASGSCCASAKVAKKNVDVKGAVLLAHR